MMMKPHKETLDKNPFEVAPSHCDRHCTCPADGEVVGEAEICPNAGGGCVVDLLIETYDVLKQIKKRQTFGNSRMLESMPLCD